MCLFLLHSTAMAWFTASYLFHCNSSRVANGFCDFVLCFCQWLLFVSLLLLRAINITLHSFGQPTACLLLSYPTLLSLLLALFLVMSLLCVFPWLSWLPAGVLRCLGGGSRWSARAATGAAVSAGLCGWPATTLDMQHGTELPAGWEGNTRWNTSASYHLVTIDRGTRDTYPALKGYSNKIPLVPVSPLTQSEKRETQQSVSLTVERVFSGRVCELCVWVTLSCLSFFSLFTKA